METVILERTVGLDLGIYDFIENSYGVRRARSLAGYIIDGHADKNTIPHLNWYLKDMLEAA